MIFRDAFIAAMSLNSDAMLFSWKDVFAIIIALLFIDFTIIGAIILKLIVVSIYTAIKRDREIFYRYCYLFELFLVLTFAHSIPLFNIIQGLILKFQKLNRKAPSPIGANVEHVKFIEANLGAMIDQLLVFTLFVGSFLVHYSRNYPISYTYILPNSEKDERKAKLERKGFVLSLKSPYVFQSVN